MSENNLFAQAFSKVVDNFEVDVKEPSLTSSQSKPIQELLEQDLGLEPDDFIQPKKTESGIEKNHLNDNLPQFIEVENNKVLIKPPTSFSQAENGSANLNPMKSFVEQAKKIKEENEKKEQQEKEEAAKNKSRFSDEDKQSVILSLILNKSFEKTKTISISSKAAFSITFKTLTEMEQSDLNHDFQLIDTIGELRDNTIMGPNGVAQKIQVKYNADANRAKRTKIFAYHLASIGTERFKTVDEAEEALKGLPTKFVDVLYTKGLAPFLELIDEACNEVEVF